MNSHNYLQITENHKRRRYLVNDQLSSKNIDEVIKFHQSTTWIPTSNMNNVNNLYLNDNWLNNVEKLDPRPNFIQGAIKLNKDIETDIEDKENIIEYVRDYTMPLDTLGKILIQSFGNRKRYKTIGDIYLSVPILLLFKDNAVDGLSAGSYYFDKEKQRLLKIKNWDSAKVNKQIVELQNNDIQSSTAIAYSIDIQKAASIYGIRGYRNALIEIGSMKQSLREVINVIEPNLIENCWSNFPDNFMSHLCGTNIRLAPILLIQWFGKRRI